MMYHKNGLFFAVTTVVMLMLFVAIAPTPVSAQSDTAARVAIQGPTGEFGDVLLVKDGEDVIVFGLAGAVSTAGQVTISADGTDPVTVNSSFLGHFPVKSQTSIRIKNGMALATAKITLIKGGSGVTVEGIIPLSITGDNVKQALLDYSSEVDKVLKGEKDTIDKGMPPHILLDVVEETPSTLSQVGKALLTQRLVIKKSGSQVNLSLVDQIEGIAGEGLQSFPPFSQVEVYGVPVDLNNPDLTKRLYLLDTVSFVDGAFVSNGYFFPFSVPNVNSSNVDALKASQTGGINTPQAADTFYLRVVQDLGDGTKKSFLARITNDVTAGIQGDVTVINNNIDNAVGAGLSAILEGIADSYAVVTAYAANDLASEWYASADADAAGKFTLKIPPTYKDKVYLDVFDPFGNRSVALKEVTTDSLLVVSESPVATPQPDGTVIIAGRTEAGAIVWVEGRNRTFTDYSFAKDTTAIDDGTFTLTGVIPFYEYKITITDLAGNRSVVTVPGDQVTAPPSDLVAQSKYPGILVTGKAEPYATILTFGFNAGVVPENPVSTDTLPQSAFFLGGSNLEYPETTAVVDKDGNFSLILPSSVGQYVYLQAVDPAGNGSLYVPLELVDQSGNQLGKNLVAFDSIAVTNNSLGVKDIVKARTVDASMKTSVSGVFVGAYRVMISVLGYSPFADQLAEPVAVADDGTFSLSIPDYSEDTGEFITQFYMVAFQQAADGSLLDVGFTLVNENNGFDRVGPEISFAPMASDLVLIEGGETKADVLNINRIYPAGTGAGLADLPVGSLPYVFIITDGNNDDVIDVNLSKIQLIDWKPLNAALVGTPLPIPGAAGLNLGINYWDASTQSVVGNSVVFVALMDAFGNYSPDPLPVYLDVYTQDPVTSLITASGTAIFANEGAVEANAKITVYENSDKSGFISTGTAYQNGGFAITDLSLTQDYVYITSKDSAENESNIVKVKVSNPVKGMDYMVLSGLGLVHTSTNTIGTLLPDDTARAISKINDTVYILLADGTITRISGLGAVPTDDEMQKVSGNIARDLEVISTNPFSAYVLLGNGIVLTYGDVPFLGDLGTPDPSIPRVSLGDGSGRMFFDLNKNGVRDTEDANGNGVLDISVGIGGVLQTEDIGIEGIADSEGNGILDEEPLVNLQSVGQGFGWDIARDMELVKDSTGQVKGYVILDGFGILWPFGTDIGSENVRPNITVGFAGSDLFRGLQLIVQDGKIVDFITVDGYGQMFGLPSDQGGVLGAGPSSDVSIAGLLSADQYGYKIYGFDIVRDIEMNPVDSNGDGTVDWKDGFYLLDGFGGIHAVGGAPEITDVPFLGLDIARDLEF